MTSRRGLLAAAGLWAAGMLATFQPMLLSGLRRMQADPGDPRFVNYTLEHDYRWAVGRPGHERLWSPPIFFPAENTAAYSDMALGDLPFYGVWRLAGLAQDTSFQWWLLTVLTLDFLACYLWLRRCLGTGEGPSAFGAFLFAFGIPRTAQLSHAQLMPHFYSIGALYGLHQAMTRPERPRLWLGLSAACVAAEFWSAYYLGWFLALGLGLALGWALAMPRERSALRDCLRRDPVWAAGIAAACGAALLPLARHYLAVAHETGYPAPAFVARMVPRVASWAYLGDSSLLFGWLDRLPRFNRLEMRSEHVLGLGLLTPLAAYAGLWGSRGRPLVRLLGLCTLSVVLLTTCWPIIGGLWPMAARWLPGAAAIRAVSRVGILMLIPASAGLAAFLDRVKKPWVIALLGLCCAAEQLRLPLSYSKEATRRRVHAVATAVESRCDAFYFSPLIQVGAQVPQWTSQLDAMWAGLESGKPTLNGYSGNSPPDWGLAIDQIANKNDDRRVSEALDRWAAARSLDRGRLSWVRLPVQEAEVTPTAGWALGAGD